MRFTTTIPARTWDWRRTHRDDALSSDAEESSQRQFCADCIITTPGYDFQEGQVSTLPFLAAPSSSQLRLKMSCPCLESAISWVCRPSSRSGLGPSSLNSLE